MEPIRFFDSVEHLEPRCPKCEIKVEYGVTTVWDNRAQAHKCRNCGRII